MSRHRFHCNALQPGRLSLSAEESHHCATVLRIRPGDEVDLFDGAGRFAVGHLVTSSKKEAVVDVARVEEAPPTSPPLLTLVTAMPRANRQQVLFEKCTELGATHIVAARFDRSTVQPKAGAEAKWRRIVIEAGKQCAAMHLPAVYPPVDFRTTMDETGSAVPNADLHLFGATGGASMPLLAALEAARQARSVCVWIGPEGGLTPDETDVLLQVGAQPVSLGSLVLRVETAAIAVAAAVAFVRDARSGR